MREGRMLVSCICSLILAFTDVTTGVIVLRLPQHFEAANIINVDNTIEYILEFTPTAEQAQWPARVWLNVDGGDTARPVLITARQPTGAQTWQLPYDMDDGTEPLMELQRTLCYRVAENTILPTETFSLHISSVNNESVQVNFRVDPARDFYLSFVVPTEANITQMASRVYYYPFPEDQENVRLVVTSADDICATVAVQNYTCPVAETVDTATRANGYFMTVQRSGGVQISRSQFPNGFFVVALVQATDKACEGEERPNNDWLYETVIGSDVTTIAPERVKRNKTLTIELRPALTRGQYAVACIVTLVLFLLFYAAFLALVFAQRFAPVQRVVGSKAVLADNNGVLLADLQSTTEEAIIPRSRTRLNSIATYDSDEDDSESDGETPPDRNESSLSNGANIVTTASADTVPTILSVTPTVTAITTVSDTAGILTQEGVNGVNLQVPPTSPVPSSRGPPEQSPRRQPQLFLATLARRQERTLRARSNRYLHTLYTVSVFYALPVVQFVVAFQMILNVSGSLDLCYYNFLCSHPWGQLSDFNHVFSNLGYLLLGALFMLQVRRRRQLRKRAPRHEDYGIPAHYGLLSSLGAGMMVVAILSASYHICPNQLNFQFDTAFMYVLAVLSMVKMYQARHPDINARAHATFGVLAVLIALVVWGVLGGGALFWGILTVLHVFTFLLLSLRIYYVGQFRLDQTGLALAARGLRELRVSRPLYSYRLIALWVANGVNWAFAFYGLYNMSADFASHLLFVLLTNTLLYMVFYLTMKLVYGERLRWYSWCYLAGALVTWVPAMYFFTSGSSSWSTTPAQSRHLNHECLVLQFYDNHDLWHMFSAIALFLSFNTMLTWDDGLSAVKRTDIAVF